MSGSRFVQCPICGKNLASHLAEAHLEQHFSSYNSKQSEAKGECGTESRSQKRTDGKACRASSNVIETAHRHGLATSDGVESEDEVQDRKRLKEEAPPPEHSTRSSSSSWSFLKSPTDKDIRGPRRTRKAFDLPPRPFDFLVVLDFEWTCDNRQRLEPLEIIEFPSVLVKTSYPPGIVSQFQVYCRPEVNPTLTPFCKQLTAITQDQVDGGLSLPEALSQHQQWLTKHNLLPLGAASSHSFAMVTWSDADIMGALDSELTRRALPRPPHFDNWINLKALFKTHYKREPRGGLQRCVEGCGLAFDGRAHSGLADSVNTAKICVQMISQGFVFKRTTRGFGPGGAAWGSRQDRERRRAEVSGGAT